jgi:hypothetical protein
MVFEEKHTWIAGVSMQINDDDRKMRYFNLRDIYLDSNIVQQLHYLQLFDNDQLGTVFKSEDGDNVAVDGVISKVENVFIDKDVFRQKLANIRIASISAMNRNTTQNYIRSTYSDVELEAVTDLIFAERNGGIHRIESVLRAIAEEPEAKAGNTDKWFIDWKIFSAFEEMTVTHLLNLILRTLSLNAKRVKCTQKEIKQGLVILAARDELPTDLTTLDMEQVRKVGYHTERVYFPMVASIKRIEYDTVAHQWIDEHGTTYDHDENLRPTPNADQDELDFLFGRFKEPQGEL